MAVRPIDGDELLGIERLLDTDAIRKSKTASWLLDQVLHDIQAMPTIDPETLPIVRQLREELERVTAERDAAIKELNGVSSLVDDLAEFVDSEIHPVVDYNLYLDLRENVDAVSMFQHEDEWRGLHKEE